MQRHEVAGKRLKIAFVNQPVDVILPLYQNSVGACTYGLVRALAKWCEVVVYGLKDRHEDIHPELNEGGVKYKFIPATRTDDVGFKIRQKYRRVFQSWEPASSASWLYPEFGRRAFELFRWDEIARDVFERYRRVCESVPQPRAPIGRFDAGHRAELTNRLWRPCSNSPGLRR